MADPMQEKEDDFEEYLRMQEDRIAKIQEALRTKHDAKSVPSESQYTTTPLNTYNDRIIEFETAEPKPARQTGICGGRLMSWSWRKVTFIIICLVIGGLAILWIQTRPEKNASGAGSSLHGKAAVSGKQHGDTIGNTFGHGEGPAN